MELCYFELELGGCLYIMHSDHYMYTGLTVEDCYSSGQAISDGFHKLIFESYIHTNEYCSNVLYIYMVITKYHKPYFMYVHLTCVLVCDVSASACVCSVLYKTYFYVVFNKYNVSVHLF